MRTLALFLTAGSLAFAPAPFPKPDSTPAELRKLQGVWVRVQCIVNGKPLGQGAQAATAAITGDRIRYAGPPMTTSEWTLRLDARKKPKTLDMKGLAGAEKDMTYWGVYHLDGDILTVCSRKGASASVRPANLQGGGEGVLVEVFKRRKR